MLKSAIIPVPYEVAEVLQWFGFAVAVATIVVLIKMALKAFENITMYSRHGYRREKQRAVALALLGLAIGAIASLIWFGLPMGAAILLSTIGANTYVVGVVTMLIAAVVLMVALVAWLWTPLKDSFLDVIWWFGDKFADRRSERARKKRAKDAQSAQMLRN